MVKIFRLFDLTEFIVLNLDTKMYLQKIEGRKLWSKCRLYSSLTKKYCKGFDKCLNNEKCLKCLGHSSKII